MNILQEKVLRTRMYYRTIFNRFPRLIRELSKTQKRSRTYEEGSDIGIDRMILDDVAESLTHLINNAVLTV